MRIVCVVVLQLFLLLFCPRSLIAGNVGTLTGRNLNGKVWLECGPAPLKWAVFAAGRFESGHGVPFAGGTRSLLVPEKSLAVESTGADLTWIETLYGSLENPRFCKSHRSEGWYASPPFTGFIAITSTGEILLLLPSGSTLNLDRLPIPIATKLTLTQAPNTRLVTP